MPLFFLACEKEEEEESDSIIGEWLWLKSTGGYSGHEVLTPSSTGETKLMRFYMDNTVNIYVNDSLVGTSKYFLTKEESILMHEEFDFVTISTEVYVTEQDTMIELSLRYIKRVYNDTLSLSADVYDGWGHLYKRKK